MSTSLLALIDDIASLLDDVAVLTKVAASRTAGVLGDDLAVNAQQVAGVRAERELPLVWAVCKGSFRNKLVLVPVALALSLLAPWAVTPLLMLGGAYLCLEGFEKLAHHWLHGGQESQAHEAELLQALQDPAADLVALERDRIAGAVRTDFVLSGEIIALTLGTVQGSGWGTQLAVLAGVAVLMTLGVYGVVAAIVKIDDLGLYLSQRRGPGALARLLRATGQGLLWAAPWLLRSLTVLGTAAMFVVGGGIVLHGLAAWLPALGPGAVPLLPELLAGLVTGALALLLGTAARRLARLVRPTAPGKQP